MPSLSLQIQYKSESNRWVCSWVWPDGNVANSISFGRFEDADRWFEKNK